MTPQIQLKCIKTEYLITLIFEGQKECYEGKNVPTLGSAETENQPCIQSMVIFMGWNALEVVAHFTT